MPQIAIQKLQAEMDKDNNDDMLQDVGNFLIDHINKNQKDADKIAAVDKTIMKSIEAMASVAKAKQKNGRARLTDSEGFTIVLKYFGIDGKASAAQAPKVVATEINLDDLF
ncbi:MAG: hypothetical protein JWM44_4185 [Bacilli bacterium]|nr:hypothetical protein [Bacilli bacterium]